MVRDRVYPTAMTAPPPARLVALLGFATLTLSCALAGCAAGGEAIPDAPDPAVRALPPHAAEPDSPVGPAIDVIAFGSCFRGGGDPAVWDAVLAQDPDLFLFIGDNVYVDRPRVPRDGDDFRQKYDALAAHPGWQALRDAVPVLATWDDHDYGLNDAGAEFPLKHVAQTQFLDFFEPGADAARRERPGIYHAHTFGPAGRRVQVILLDTRFFRGPLTRNEDRARRRGPYRPDPDSTSGVLGDAQWAWLEEQLRQPADLRVIASSIQVVADEHGWETWGNLPHERERLYQMIDDTDAAGVVFVSGDRHLLELSCDTRRATPYPLWDATSSGLDTGPQTVSEPNRSRVGGVFRGTNFGVLRVDWDADRPAVTLEGRGKDGVVITTATVPLDTLCEDDPAPGAR